MSRKLIYGFLATGMFLILISTIAGFGRNAEGTPANADAPDKSLLETQIIMAQPDIFKELERPPVLFDHQRHTKALEDKSCDICHLKNKKGTLTYGFLEVKEKADRRSIIDAYHAKCNGCHGGNGEGSEKAHDLGCGECHVEKLQYQTAEWYPAVFEHVNHLEAMEESCGTCHHEYDEAQGALVYQKGNEATCSNCHKMKDEGTRLALQKAGHVRCIGCHEQKYLEGKRKENPYVCQGCHKLEGEPAQPEIEILTIRPYQSEPEKLLIGYPGSILPPVPYDHKKHVEEKTCNKACHPFHARTLVETDTRFLKTGDACNQCHTQAKVEMTADAINADEVYHNAESPHSCIGCHTQKNKEITKADEKTPVKCTQCHTGEETLVEVAKAAQGQPPKEGPETYIISRLSKKRLPVEFKHALHVKMIEKCNGCHHDSPENEYPQCDACHGISANFGKTSTVKLVSAYHRMCLGCHRSIGAGPITCVKCHEEREAQNWVADQDLQTTTAGK